MFRDFFKRKEIDFPNYRSESFVQDIAFNIGDIMNIHPKLSNKNREKDRDSRSSIRRGGHVLRRNNYIATMAGAPVTLLIDTSGDDSVCRVK